MYRATTPRHTFVFDVDPIETFKTILITYGQCGRIILEKGKEDLSEVETETAGGKTLYSTYLQLTQGETRKFNTKGNVKVQIRALTVNGEALASEMMDVSVWEVLNDEVLT